VVIADPLFVSPETGDWTLRPESPALKLGFTPFDWRKAGVTGDDAWRKLAAVEYPPVTYGVKPTPRPLTLYENFEKTPLGSGPKNGARVSKRPGVELVVVKGGSKSGRSLELRDGPEVQPAYEPHFYYIPYHDKGTTKVSFDVRMEPEMKLIHEWRDDAQPYHSGPQLIFEQGAVNANGRKLIDLPAEGWLRVEVEARIGAKSDGTWRVTFTSANAEPQTFEGLRFLEPDMKKVDWIGWMGNGTAAAKAWLDEIRVENE
jgi:hypothetical protein